MPGAKSLYTEGRGWLARLSLVPWGFLDPFYEGLVQAVEEAVIDVLVVNYEMVGFLGTSAQGFRTTGSSRCYVRGAIA